MPSKWAYPDDGQRRAKGNFGPDMGLEIAYCSHRLLFKHPFATSHGVRDGTDVLFIRLTQDGLAGYGEVTLPPYVTENIPDTIQRLAGVAARGPYSDTDLFKQLDTLAEVNGAPAFRAGLSTALIDILSKRLHKTVRQHLEVTGSKRPVTLMTIGICPSAEVAARMAQLPHSGGLKLKVGDEGSEDRIALVRQLDSRRILLDGNQGTVSLADALRLASVAGEALIGFEQPFSIGQEVLHHELVHGHGLNVYADESIQSMEDLRVKHAAYTGVNLKLMKCGGLDVAKAMAAEARRYGMEVMLGSMSESSLGCTAMAQLASVADIVDLDGPWLIHNDPFVGIGMVGDTLRLPDGPGLGVTLTKALDFTPCGA